MFASRVLSPLRQGLVISELMLRAIPVAQITSQENRVALLANRENRVAL